MWAGINSGSRWRRCSLATAGFLAVAGCCMMVGRGFAQTGKFAAGAKDGRLVGKGVRIPIEYDAEGRVKSELNAETATLPNEQGEIRADKVMMVVLQDGADTKGTVVTTDSCRISPSNNTARSDSLVRVDQTGLVITGNGFRWHGSRDHIRIMRDARVVISRSFVEQRQGASSAPTSLPGFEKAGY